MQPRRAISLPKKKVVESAAPIPIRRVHRNPFRSIVGQWTRRRSVICSGLILALIATVATFVAYGRFTLVAHIYGDSYSYGIGASDPSRRFSTILCQTMGWREVNHSVGGTMAADPAQSGAIIHNAAGINDRSIAVWLLGFNDAQYYGVNAGLGDFLSCVESGTSLLAIPAASRLAHDDDRITYQGMWHVPESGGMHVADQRGSVALFSLTGRTILVGTFRSVGNDGSLRVLVDGKERAVSTNRMQEPTAAMTRFQPALVKITGLSMGAHAIRCESMNDSQTAICWAAGLSGERLKPSVYVGGVMAVGPSGYDSAGAGSLKAADLFSAGLEQSMSELKSFGLNIQYSRPTLDVATQLSEDRIHPNDAGHLAIAQQIATVMSGAK